MTVLDSVLRPQKKLDEEFVYLHLMFVSLDEAQAELDKHFPGSTIAQVDNDWIIYDKNGAKIATIAYGGAPLV